MANVIIKTASVISAAAVTAGAVVAAVKWYLSQKKQAEKIVRIKEENTLICYALSACLDGLGQLGANHSVTSAKEKTGWVSEQAGAQMNRTSEGKEPRSVKTLDLILILLGGFMTIFTAVMIVTFYIKDSVPDTLIACVMGAGSAEGVLTAAITISKMRTSAGKGERSGEDERRDAG